MGKKKTIFVCQNCGATSLRWVGKCPECDSWNSMVEEMYDDSAASSPATTFSTGKKPVAITTIPSQREFRLATGIEEFDRTLGGGLLPGCVVLVAGEPGIGKSTLLLQVARYLCEKTGQKVLYVTGEESKEQIRLRAERLDTIHPELLILCETNVNTILQHIEEIKPYAVIIDSIQSLFCPELGSVPGSVAQVRESALRLHSLSKKILLPMFFIGHVTKTGVVAGPRVLEHLVDTVLYFEGDRQYVYRILRVVKNRYGATDELGIFEMRTEGLVEVKNPSAIFLRQRGKAASGSMVTASVEGTRTLLVEVQALTSYSGGFGLPRRSASGCDPRRLALILAVLEKRVGLKLFDQDVYVNIAGGIRIFEPAIDLAMALSIVSSLKNIPLATDTIAFGEIGLGGEIRPVRLVESRVREAERLGFKHCLLAYDKRLSTMKSTNIKFITADSFIQAVNALGL